MRLAIIIFAVFAFCLTPFCANAAPTAKRTCCRADAPDNMGGMRCCCNDETKAPAPAASLPTAVQMAGALPMESGAPVMRRRATVEPSVPLETGSPPYLTNCRIIC